MTLKTAAEVSMARAEALRAVRPNTARGRIADLWDVTQSGDGTWTLAHREHCHTLELVKLDDRGRLMVNSDSGGSYIVNYQHQTCSCPDHQHRGRQCRHLAAMNALADWCQARKARSAEKVAA